MHKYLSLESVMHAAYSRDWDAVRRIVGRMESEIQRLTNQLQESRMSYSAAVKKPTKAEALVAIQEQLDEVVKTQPMHAADIPHVSEATTKLVAALVDDGNQDVNIYISGSVSWRGVYGDGNPAEVTGASASISVSLMPRPATP